MVSKPLITLPVGSIVAQPDSRATRTEMTLEEQYADDPVLLRLYKKKLVIPGWAGLKDKMERRFSAATRRALGKKPRGKSFRAKPLAPSQHGERLERNLDGVEDVRVPTAAAR